MWKVWHASDGLMLRPKSRSDGSLNEVTRQTYTANYSKDTSKRAAQWLGKSFLSVSTRAHHERSITSNVARESPHGAFKISMEHLKICANLWVIFPWKYHDFHGDFPAIELIHPTWPGRPLGHSRLGLEPCPKGLVWVTKYVLYIFADAVLSSAELL